MDLGEKMKNSRSVLSLLLIVILCSSLAVNIFLGIRYVSLKKNYDAAQLALAANQKSAKIISFAKFLIDNVLNAAGTVPFETRLQLENAVRDLDDTEILAQWKIFTASQTEAQMQTEITKLLGLLMKKAS